MLREHGFQGLRMWQKGWLRAVTLPVNAHVDRSVCAEFQVLNELCDLAHQSGLADSVEECPYVAGSVQVLVSTTPCLSCVCAVLQYNLLFPAVHLAFSCVQPWHAEGGADGALREAAAQAARGGAAAAKAGVSASEEEGPLVPAVWEGGRIVGSRAIAAPQRAPVTPELVEPPEPLTPRELEALQRACRRGPGGGRAAEVDLSSVSTWEDVQNAVARSTPDTLAEVLRAHRQAVRPETQPERAAKVLGLLRGLVGAEVQEGIAGSTERMAATSGDSSFGAMRTRTRSAVRWRMGP